MRLKVSLMLLILFVGCSAKSNCPVYPVPSEHVVEKFEKLAETDKEVWEWGNKLLDLQEELENCD